MADLAAEEERKVLEKFRQAKRMRHAELRVIIKDGYLDHLSVTEKEDLGALRRLRPNWPGSRRPPGDPRGTAGD